MDDNPTTFSGCSIRFPPERTPCRTGPGGSGQHQLWQAPSYEPCLIRTLTPPPLRPCTVPGGRGGGTKDIWFELDWQGKKLWYLFFFFEKGSNTIKAA